jgi:hypothetical protein
MILVDDLGFAGAIPSHSGGCLSATWHAPRRRSAFAVICAGGDVSIARRLMMRCQPEHRLERDVTADSGDREQSVHSIMNTDSGDHEHLFAPD